MSPAEQAAYDEWRGAIRELAAANGALTAAQNHVRRAHEALAAFALDAEEAEPTSRI